MGPAGHDLQTDEQMEAHTLPVGLSRPLRKLADRRSPAIPLPGYDGFMEPLGRITMDPEVMGGKPCIRGLRVTVGMIVEAMAAGRTVEQLLADFP